MYAVLQLYRSTIGKKVLMAVSGVVLFGFLVGHLAGNLLVYAGPRKLNDYAAWLRMNSGMLWGARIVLLFSVAAHIVAAVQLAVLNRGARPVGYVRRDYARASYAARTMIWSGPILALYIVYHILHFTTGAVHPQFDSHNVYRNVVEGFRVWPVSVAYIVAMLALGLHLFHGLWSMFQSLGLNHPKYDALLAGGAACVTGVLIAGYLSIPVSVLAGWVM